MPEISRFLGIVIRMYFLIQPVGLLHGAIPPRALALVVEWANLHQDELLANWRRLHADEPPARIAPLE